MQNPVRQASESSGTELQEHEKKPTFVGSVDSLPDGATIVLPKRGRDVLREWGINSLEDFRLRERAIVEYLTHKWFRLLKNPKVRGAENDAEIHPIWKRVQSLFFQYFCCAEVLEVKREKPACVSVDSERLENQGGGSSSRQTE